MPKTRPWEIEPLDRHHSRQGFDCLEPALNQFIQAQARQQQDKHLSRTFVACAENDSTRRVLGFYTISAGSILFQSLPPKLQKKLPRYPIPVARLGRLAVDHSMKGKKLGDYLLRHALLRVAAIAENDIGIVAVIVDAKNDDVAEFYQRYGFVSFEDSPQTLFLPVKTILATACDD